MLRSLRPARPLAPRSAYPPPSTPPLLLASFRLRIRDSWLSPCPYEAQHSMNGAGYFCCFRSIIQTNPTTRRKMIWISKVTTALNSLAGRMLSITGIPTAIKKLTKTAIAKNRLLLAAFISTFLVFVPAALAFGISLWHVDFSQKWMYPFRYVAQAFLILVTYLGGLSSAYDVVKAKHARWVRLFHRS